MMRGEPLPARDGKFLSWVAGVTVVTFACAAAEVGAQPAPAAGPPAQFSAAPADAAAPAGDMISAGCSTCGGGGCAGCGGGHRPLQTMYEDDYAPGDCPSCCYPGTRSCGDCWGGNSFLGKFCAGLRECICCPDPCYEPRYIQAANAAFFVDTVRPVTQMRLRYDNGWNMTAPDRAEFFMAKFANSSPSPPGKGRPGPLRRIDYHDLSLYMEGATPKFGMFVQQTYRHLDPYGGVGAPAGSLAEASQFGDLLIGTKTVLLDCELMLLTLQFQTFVPIGAVSKGIGTGHVSLEPSFLAAIKLAQDFYLQAQTAYWVPIGGDPTYQGNVWHNHLSFNRVLQRWSPGTMLIGTAEFNEWTVLNGAYTSPSGPFPVSATTGIFSLGPGLRMVICNNIDFGVGTAFAVTGSRWAQDLIRTGFRWRY